MPGTSNRSPCRLNESAAPTKDTRLLEAATLTFERLDEASTKASAIKVKGVAGQADLVNANGRLYPLATAKAAVEAAQANITAGKFLMLEEHPDWDEPFTGELDDVAARVTALSISDTGTITYEATLINNECGQNIAALLEAGVMVQASTRAEGVSEWVKAGELGLEGLDPELMVQRITSMTFLGVDFTLNPSVSSTNTAMTESQKTPPTSKEEPTVKDLKELKEKYPEIYAAAMNESQTQAQSANVEAELARLKAENDKLKTDALNSVRSGIVTRALSEANLPKLGNAGEINLDERFERQVESAALSAASDADAKKAVDLLITERRALLGQNTSIRTNEGANRVGLPAGNVEKTLTEAQQEGNKAGLVGVNSARSALGL
jgi:hypothetical protein